MKHPQQGCPVADHWKIRDPFHVAASSGPVTIEEMNRVIFGKHEPERKDLTPRQIEWCRENLFKRKEKVVNG